VALTSRPNDAGEHLLGVRVSGRLPPQTGESRARLGAIRYPSDACRRVGAKGWNVAIFPQAIMAPSWLRIRGRSGKPLEELP